MAIHQPPILTFDGVLISDMAIRDCGHAEMTERSFRQRNKAANEPLAGRSMFGPVARNDPLSLRPSFGLLDFLF